MRMLQLGLLLAVIAAISLGTAKAEQIFWTDPVGASGSHFIRRAGPGPGLQTIVAGLREPRGIALDFQGGKIYWNEPGNFRIQRANLDGSDVAPIVVTSDIGSGVTLDIPAGKMYWTDGVLGSGLIRRSNLDGSFAEDLVTSGLFHPGGIALDAVHQKVYWTDLEGYLDGNGEILRSNLDGSNVETILTGIDEAAGIAIDPVRGKLYWPELATKKIQRANLDGSELEDIVTGLLNPTTVALDLATNKLYWTDSFGGPAADMRNRIQRANLDGSDVTTIVSGVGLPWGIAVVSVPEPTALGMFVASCLVFFPRLRTKRVKASYKP